MDAPGSGPDDDRSEMGDRRRLVDSGAHVVGAAKNEQDLRVVGEHVGVAPGQHFGSQIARHPGVVDQAQVGVDRVEVARPRPARGPGGQRVAQSDERVDPRRLRGRRRRCRRGRKRWAHRWRRQDCRDVDRTGRLDRVNGGWRSGHRCVAGRNVTRGTGRCRIGPATGQAGRYRDRGQEQGSDHAEISTSLILRDEAREESHRGACWNGTEKIRRRGRDGAASGPQAAESNPVSHAPARRGNPRVGVRHVLGLQFGLQSIELHPSPRPRPASTRTHARRGARISPRPLPSSMLSACNWTRVGLLRISVPCAVRGLI
jgi:hypothetical protein